MFKSHLKIALRNLLKHKGYSFINLAGLAIGMACAVLILLYVRNELDYDQYHEKKDRIYRLISRLEGASYEAIAKVGGPWGPAVRENVPEVEEMARFVFFNEILVSRGDQRAYEAGGLFADSSVFRIFSFKLIAGNPQTALVNPNAVVVTEDFARKYFGEEDPIGQTLKFDNQNDYLVTGVMANVPAHSHFTFDFLVSMASYANPQRENWQWNQFYTYLLLRPGASPQTVAEKFTPVLRSHLETNAAARYMPTLQPMVEIHLHSHLFREMQPNSDVVYVYILSALALFILLIAGINFVNLTTARALQRAKEVGVRKTAGAHQPALIKQFLGESILISFIALVLALVLIEFLLPGFNALTNRALALDYSSDKILLAGLIGLALVVGVASGSYPAFVLSSFKPVEVFKSQRTGSRRQWLRQGLVVFQFGISACLMIATGIVYRQLEYIQNKNLGFNEEQLITLPIRDEAMRQKRETVKRELLQNSNVLRVSVSGNLPGGGDWGIPYVPEGIPQDQIPPMRDLVVDHEFVETFGMEIVAGRNFSQDHVTDAGAYLINETAARELGWNEPLGKTIAMPNVQRAPGPVIGVVKDFHFRSMHEKIGPIMLFIPPPEWFRLLTVRIRPENVAETLAFLERKWAELDPAHPFTYTFFDERFAALHQTEMRTGQLLGYFSLLAILIACLGLFGLAAFSAGQRTKEIGIRKVMGASVAGIVALLSKEFLKLVLLANVIAWPLAWYLMNNWVDDFAYRIEIGWEVFVLAGVLALLIALVTVSVQAIKAALANPVEALRYE